MIDDLFEKMKGEWNGFLIVNIAAMLMLLILTLYNPKHVATATGLGGLPDWIPVVIYIFVLMLLRTTALKTLGSTVWNLTAITFSVLILLVPVSPEMGSFKFWIPLIGGLLVILFTGKYKVL